MPASEDFGARPIATHYLELPRPPLAISFDQEWNSAIGRRSRRNGDVRVLIIIGHSGRFQLPVLLAVLDNAQGVDPEIFHAQSPTNSDCILEYSREATPRDTMHHLCEVILRGPDRLAAAPAVAQSCVGRAPPLWLDEPDLVRIVAFDAEHSRRQKRVRGFGTFVVSGQARIEMSFDEPEAVFGVRTGRVGAQTSQRRKI